MARVSDQRPRQNLSADVLIVGGGAAGLAAASTAAKAGVRVLLLEKYGFCGGAAVAGLSGTVCGLFAATDNRSAAPERVVFGFVDRFLDVMKTKGGVTDPVRYGKTFTLTHDPLVWREAGDYLLAEAGAKILFHTTVVDALRRVSASMVPSPGPNRGVSTFAPTSPSMRAVMRMSQHWPVSRPSLAVMAQCKTRP